MTKTEDKPWLSGKPYYCNLCGCGGPEVVACEEPDCEMESKEEAEARRRAAGLGAPDGP